MKRKEAARKEKGEDLRTPPIFSKSFYRQLAEYAEEFAVTRAEFAFRALRHYAKELRMRGSTLNEALGDDDAKRYGEVQSKLTKKWWASMTPEQRKARTKKANEARWAQKRKAPKKGEE
jgi:hypothetical protein